MKINNKCKLNIVVGAPLLHSQSPELHKAAYEFLNISAVMMPLQDVKLSWLIKKIKTIDINLIAVTSPYKEKIIKYLDHLSREVKMIGSANTIIHRRGKLYGYNTDLYGISYALRKVKIKGKRVLVIGAGGAARTMGYFLKKNSAQIFWLNRTRQKAKTLAQNFGGVVIDKEINTQKFDLIVNTTSLGMYPTLNESPLAEYKFNKKQIVFDMIYNPNMTQFLKNAQSDGAKIISGMDMFIGQGLKQIELLSRKFPSETVIRKIKNYLMNCQKYYELRTH